MRALCVLALAAALAGCGSTAARHHEPKRVAATTTCASPAKTKRELERLHADLRAIRRAAAKVHRSSLMGSPALMGAVSTFLDHEEAASIPNLTKNRLIDLAASASVDCEQCFQMLEASRPIAGKPPRC
jgi:hypothetical protein